MISDEEKEVYDFRINLSVSKENYMEKPNFKAVRYQKKTNLSIHDYASLILKGYCFCHLYNTSLAEFGQREKTISNFQQTNFLWLDVDNATLKMDEALSLLT